jgi:NAD(P)H-binding
MSMMTSSQKKKLVVLYGIGGLSDVGRHAILAGLEHPTVVSQITVITEYPELLDEANWECGCPGGHTNPSKDHADIVKVVKVDDWKNPPSDLADHFSGAAAVISCLGHRQPGYKYPQLITRGLVAEEGNLHVIKAMKQNQIERAVVMSSFGVQEDWPPAEFHIAGKIMQLMFKTNSKRPFRDLTQMELAYKDEANKAIDYLFVRPVGISEDVEPCGEYWLQQEKFKDAVGINMAKMDVARFMVKEALEPTLHRRGVVVGSKPPKSRKK